MIKKLILITMLLGSTMQAVIAATVTTDKATYTTNEQVNVHFANMVAKNKDWIGVYPANSNNDWGNVIAWKWTNDTKNGDVTFNALPVGAYEVRAFYNNSFQTEATKGFTVEDAAVVPAAVTTNKATYTSNEQITVNFTNMSAKNKDWIGIYPEGSNNDWANVVAWKWTNDITNGNVNFNALPVGNYEVRVFYNNSFHTEATKGFKVEDAVVVPAAVTTNKATYTSDEQITVNFTNMTGKNQDWIGIYPEGTSNNFNNVVAWKWTNDISNGNLIFNALPVGNYEVRAFYNNSVHLEASKKFKVENANVPVAVTTNKATYAVDEQIVVNFSNMTGKNQDWIGIYPEGSTNDWANVVAWKWTNDTANGNLTFDALPVGAYEVRAFYNNSFETETTTGFTVEGDAGPDNILYFDGEHGDLDKWVKYAGNTAGKIINTGAQGSAHSFRAAAWSGFYFDFGTPAKKLKYLNLDVRVGISSHVGNFGVYVKTKKGTRRILFSTYMNHPGNDWSGLPPEEWDKPYLSNDGDQHNHPAPSDYFLIAKNGSSEFTHYKINIDEKLKILEPDNEVLSIQLFTTAGGDFDNLSLSAN